MVRDIKSILGNIDKWKIMKKAKPIVRQTNIRESLVEAINLHTDILQ